MHLSTTPTYGYRFDWQTVLYAGYSSNQVLLDGHHFEQDASQCFVKIAYAFEP
jgi:hypothetical protein